MTVAYWEVVRSEIEMPCFGRGAAFEVKGTANELIVLDTRRPCPLDELEAIAAALNALPQYRTAAAAP